MTNTLDPNNFFTNSETHNEYLLVVPKIRDGDSFLIMPDEYAKKFQNISIVLLNVHLKMYAPFFFF
jgi:hypothetical protein